MSLETLTGNLRDAYKQLQLGTMLHVDQLMNERRHNANLRGQCFYTADGEIYFLDDVNKTPTLAITREAQNPVLQNIDDALDQLTNNGNYLPSQADVQQALVAPDTVLITLPSLCLSGKDKEWRYLEIGTTPAKYNQLNGEQRKFAERVYGQGDDFVHNMKRLNSADISNTRIYVLNPDYVRQHAEAGAIARASWLNFFYVDSLFYSDERYFNYHDRVRGVRRGASVSEQEAPGGRDAQKTTPYREQGAVLGPSVQEILEYSASFVPEIVREQYEVGLRNPI
ncbi:MAG: hypothetical protein AABX24_00845 [Nanoarchaeota archaeon]|mgnify:CR=1 FL=1